MRFRRAHKLGRRSLKRLFQRTRKHIRRLNRVSRGGFRI